MWTEAVVGFAARLTPAAAADVAAAPGVAAVELDRRVRVRDIDQPSPPWGLDRVDQRDLPLDGRYRAAADGAGVTTYVVDTGLRRSHREFQGRVLGGYSVIGSSTADCEGHGTHVSGTAVGSTYGVAKRAEVVPVRALNCRGSGSNAGIIDALNWIAGDASGPSVVNMSLGGSPSVGLDAAVENLTEAGVSVVIAAGNESKNACRVSPARVASALTVGALSRDDRTASFSNVGPCVDVWGPGVGVLSAGIDSNRDESRKSGTSMASPHAAGVAALYLENHPCADPAEVSRAVLGGATPASPGPRLFAGFDSVAADVPGQLLCNTGFEDGDDSSWFTSGAAITSSDRASARTGAQYAWLGGYGEAADDRLLQTVRVPAGGTLTYYVDVDTEETTSSTDYDQLSVSVIDHGVETSIDTVGNLDAAGGYLARTVSLAPFAGRSVWLAFDSHEDDSNATSFYLDDVTVTR